jgi:UDP-2-acetamido-3-amino-2,3-dideoxy-glucuronate N-acetyltransferase
MSINKEESIFIHPSSYVEEKTQIGQGTKIWHFSHICSGSKIGQNVTIGQNVYIASKASIGSNCKIQNNVSIYDCVILESDVFCGPSVVFTNVINPRSFVERKNEYMETIVKKGVTLGANSTIVCGIILGEYSLIGAGSVVTKDVKPYSLNVGNPSKQIGWIDKCGEKLNLPLFSNSSLSCISDGMKYILRGDQIHVEDA